MKARTGYVYQNRQTGTWYARVTHVDERGKRKNVQRKGLSKSHAREVLKELIRLIDEDGPQAIDVQRLTFADLCDYYEKHYATEVQYANNRKVAGLRSVVTVRGYVKVFRQHFGNQQLRSLAYEDLRMFRLARLSTSTQQSERRSLTTVNREMAYLRRLLTIAERNGWIRRNPFRMGDPLIHTADEVKRERIINREEEMRLLAACIGPRGHLRAIIICALDTGMRQGEILKLRWRDVNLSDHVITITGLNTKTMRERQVSITTRLSSELDRLPAERVRSEDDLVFGLTDVRQGFKRACRAAGLDGLRFHDLRHTHASRLDDLGFSLAKIGGQLGHTVLQTTLRYVNRDREAIRQVSVALDGLNGEADVSLKGKSVRESVD
jgi:integrase